MLSTMIVVGPSLSIPSLWIEDSSPPEEYSPTFQDEILPPFVIANKYNVVGICKLIDLLLCYTNKSAFNVTRRDASQQYTFMTWLKCSLFEIICRAGPSDFHKSF